jgi:sugar (pentulose or hexulose) kinase
MSMALQSAWLLSHTLQRARSRRLATEPFWHTPVARDYAAQWARRFQPRLRTAAVFARLAMHPMAAPTLLALMQAHPPLLTRAARWAGKADGFDNFSRSNDDGKHPDHPAADADQGLPTGA